ncbi:Zn2Cys6 transcription factor protein [Rutstroemia sp. NJR-2017a BVV2]|nr:Zn2Cys6 transcription factor protein [Rutstroemia sp. NJR-2017a BVV2]
MWQVGQVDSKSEMEDTPSESSRKRPRPVVSCLRCREKKLKCDRMLPCHNCTKSSRSSACTYSDDVNPGSASKRQVTMVVERHPANDRGLSRDVEAPATNGTVKPASSSGAGVVEDLQLRVANLEKLLHVSIKASGLNVSAPQVESQSPVFSLTNDARQPQTTAPEPYTLIVKGQRSRYHGPNDRVTLLSQFQETKDFINNIPKDSQSIINLAKDIEYLQKESQKSVKVRSQSVLQRNARPLTVLEESLPGKQTCDRLFNIYVDQFEKTLRVLHVPSLLRNYEGFWKSNGRNFDTSAFLPLLMTILAIGHTLDDRNDSNYQHDEKSYLHSSALDDVENLILRIDTKHRIEFATLQTETLLVIARQLRGCPADELWRATGSLVRSATIMGLHLNPARLNKISPFQAELRRRLWTTIVQMDLDASIAANMPIANTLLDFDGMIPTNIDDKDFDESTEVLPPSKPLSEWTDALPQVVLAMVLPQQLKIVGLMKSATPGTDLTQTVEEGRKLNDFLESLPLLRLDTTSHRSVDLLKRILVNIYLRRPLLHLYSIIIRQDSQMGANFADLQQFCLESSVGVLNYRDHFDPMVTDPSITNSNSSWKLFNVYFKNDVILAFLTICQYVRSLTTKTQTLDQNPVSAHTRGSDTLATDPQFTKAKLIRLLENTLDSLIESSADTGTDIKDILFLSVAIQSVRSSSTGRVKEKLMRDGATKALSAYRESLLRSCSDTDTQLPSQTRNSTIVEVTSRPNEILMREHQEYTRSMDTVAVTGEPTAIVQPNYMPESIPSAMSLDQGNMFGFSDTGIFDIDYDWGYFDIGQ